MSYRHTILDLKQMQAMPLEAKIIMSQRRIKDWYDSYRGNVYLSFSGGKDSTVLKHLIDTTVGVSDVPSVFVNTGLEYPEIYRFVKAKPGVTVIRPEMRFDQVIRRYGYPVITKDTATALYYVRKRIEKGKPLTDARSDQLFGRFKGSRFDKQKWAYLLDADFKISGKCCGVMKKVPLHAYEKETGRMPYIGTMAEESVQRKSRWMRYGCNGYEMKRPSSMPLAFWTEQDVIRYIRDFHVDYCPVYGEIIETEDGRLVFSGVNRTGCIFCGFGCHLEKEPNRFQLLQKTHPRQYEYCIYGGEYVDGVWMPNKEGLGLAHVFDVLGVPYKREKDLIDLMEEDDA